MKKQRLLAMLLIAELFIICVFALAAGESQGSFTLTISHAQAGHSYTVYQIFTGDYNDGTLSNIQWGASVIGTAAMDASEYAEELAGMGGQAAAQKVSRLVNLSEAGGYRTVAAQTGSDETSAVFSGLPAGYYLIADTTGETVNRQTVFMLQVAGNVTVMSKGVTAPVPQKKVRDFQDTDGTFSDWQDSADWDIGDWVPFRLQATMPTTGYELYEKYYLAFHDTIEPGFELVPSFNEGDIVVKVDGVDITKGYRVTKQSNGFTVEFSDVKSAPVSAGPGSVISIEYAAQLACDAVVGSQGNKNGMFLTYYDAPAWDGTGVPPTGETTTDSVSVFTYELYVRKVDDEENPLQGASFRLEKKAGDFWFENALAVLNENGTVFRFNGLSDGTYRLTEVSTPAGYNTMKPVEFEIAAEHDALSDNPTLKSVRGVTSSDLEFTVNDGTLSLTVVNNSGVMLPATGGVGTTILYVIGGILLLAAVVVLLIRHYMREAAR